MTANVQADLSFFKQQTIKLCTILIISTNLICIRRFLRKFLMQTENQKKDYHPNTCHAWSHYLPKLPDFTNPSFTHRFQSLRATFSVLSFRWGRRHIHTSNRNFKQQKCSATQHSTLPYRESNCWKPRSAITAMLDCSSTGSIRRGERERNASVTSSNRRSN